MSTTNGLKIGTRPGMAEADAKMHELLAGEAPGILTEVDVSAPHQKMGDLGDNPAMAQVAGEADSRLGRVIDVMTEEDADA